MTDEQKNKLEILAESYSQEISLAKVASHYFENAPTLRWSKEAYYRLLITELIPEDINRIIYLDCDTVINKSLVELFKLDINNNYVSMLKEDSSTLPRKRLGLNEEGNYYQSGVILFDIQKSKNVLSYESSSEIISQLGDKLEVVDQDVLNVMFDTKIFPLPEKFNNCEITNFNKSSHLRFFNKTNPKEIKETVVLHYATGKPWNNLYSGSCEDIWYTYLKLSPYAYLYDEKYNTLKYRIFRTGLFKSLFFEYIHITPILNKTALGILPQKAYLKIKKYYREKIK